MVVQCSREGIDGVREPRSKRGRDNADATGRTRVGTGRGDCGTLVTDANPLQCAASVPLVMPWPTQPTFALPNSPKTMRRSARASRSGMAR